MAGDVYTVAAVTYLLTEYVIIRTRLIEPGNKSQSDTVIYEATPSTLPKAKRPLGFTPTGTPWPFMEGGKRASTPRDGKKKARAIEGILISLVDLEAGLRATPDDDLELLYKYYLFGTRTLDELCRERDVATTEMMLRRCEHAVERLTDRLNKGHIYRKEAAPSPS